jgi:SAM-dependent methyltransferase
MREVPYESHFDLVANFFTSFGYFEDDSDNQKVLMSIAKALKPGGKFLIDYMNPDYVVRNLVERDEKNLGPPSALIPTEVGDPNIRLPKAAAPSAKKAEGLRVIQERWIDTSAQRINKKITLIRNGKESTYRESVRMYSHREMRNMLSKAGLKLTETYGDFDGSEYTQDSPRMILMGEK